MTPLSSQSTTELVHVGAQLAAVRLTRRAAMSEGASVEERGRRMAPNRPMALLRLDIPLASRVRQRAAASAAANRLRCASNPVTFGSALGEVRLLDLKKGKHGCRLICHIVISA